MKHADAHDELVKWLRAAANHLACGESLHPSESYHLSTAADALMERQSAIREPNAGDVVWLHWFLNASAFGPPPSEIQRAHAIVDALTAASYEKEDM